MADTDFYCGPCDHDLDPSGNFFAYTSGLRVILVTYFEKLAKKLFWYDLYRGGKFAPPPGQTRFSNSPVKKGLRKFFMSYKNKMSVQPL